MKKRSLLMGIIGFIIVVPSMVFANGFQVNWQSAKAVGMSEAFTAQADDPSAVYYNPAGITQLDGKNLMIGSTVITTQHKLIEDDGTTYSGDTGIFVVPNMYYTQKINEKLDAGIGVFANYGLGISHDDGFPTQYLTGNRRAVISSMSVNPVMAYKVNDKLSLSGGVVYQQASLLFKSDINSSALTSGAVTEDGHWKMDMDDNGAWGYNFGALYKITDSITFGASYRSKIKHSVSGDSSVAVDSSLSALASALDKDVSTEFSYPAIGNVGVSYKINKWTHEADLMWIDWSEFDKLVIPELGATSQKNYKDTVSVHVGSQYQANDIVALRCGLGYEPSPVPSSTIDATLPSGDRYSGSLGIGFNFKPWTLDLGYEYIYDKGGRYDNSTGTDSLTGIHYAGNFEDVKFNILAISVTRQF